MSSSSSSEIAASPLGRGYVPAAAPLAGQAGAKKRGIQRKTANLTSLAGTLNKLEQGKYIPPHLLKKHENELRRLGYDVKEFSGKATLTKAMRVGESSFAPAKPANFENLQGIRRKKQPFPKKSLTRMITGDIPPERFVGLGRMKEDKVTPAEGYKDVFVSSLEEYEKKGIDFSSDSKNDPANMAEKLDLKGDDLAKIKNQGAWLILIEPGSKLAIPTERKSEWNPGYVEGGYTGSEQQEWVTPNIGLDSAVRAREARIFKMGVDGKTVEWKFFQGKLMPQDEWRKEVDGHVSLAVKRYNEEQEKKAQEKGVEGKNPPLPEWRRTRKEAEEKERLEGKNSPLPPAG